jgi:hypothetical protein
MAHSETHHFHEREIVMHQQAIIFMKDNASLIADQLIDYTNPEDLLNDYGYMLNPSNVIILVRSVFEDGVAVLSHVVTMSMFLANATASALSDTEFNDVTQL